MPLKRKCQGHLCPYQSFFIDYEYNVTYTKLTEKICLFKYRPWGIKEDINLLCEGLVAIRGLLRYEKSNKNLQTSNRCCVNIIVQITS